MKRKILTAAMLTCAVFGGVFCYQATSKAPVTIISQAANPEYYVNEDSDSSYVTASDLKGMSKTKLRLMRNEIFARHGRNFDDIGLWEYFSRRSWYDGTIEPGDFKNSVLNKYEKANIKTIEKAEKKASGIKVSTIVKNAESYYEEVNDKIDNGELEELGRGGVTTWSQDGYVYKVRLEKGNEAHLHFQYDMEYYFNDNNDLVFMFAKDGSKEQRWYFGSAEILFRYIGPKGKKVDYKNGKLITGKSEEYLNEGLGFRNEWVGEDGESIQNDEEEISNAEETQESEFDQELIWIGAYLTYDELDTCDMSESGLQIDGNVRYGSMDDIWSDDIPSEYMNLNYPFADNVSFHADDGDGYEKCKELVDVMNGLFLQFKVENGEITSVIISS